MQGGNLNVTREEFSDDHNQDLSQKIRFYPKFPESAYQVSEIPGEMFNEELRGVKNLAKKGILEETIDEILSESPENK